MRSVLSADALQALTGWKPTVALSEGLRGALEKTGKNVDKLLAEKGDLASALSATKERLEELRS